MFCCHNYYVTIFETTGQRRPKSDDMLDSISFAACEDEEYSIPMHGFTRLGSITSTSGDKEQEPRKFLCFFIMLVRTRLRRTEVIKGALIRSMLRIRQRRVISFYDVFSIYFNT